MNSEVAFVTNYRKAIFIKNRQQYPVIAEVYKLHRLVGIYALVPEGEVARLESL